MAPKGDKSQNAERSQAKTDHSTNMRKLKKDPEALAAFHAIVDRKMKAELLKAFGAL